MSIYTPSEDSFFFAVFLKEYLKKIKVKEISYIDIGTGSGILSEIASEFIKKENILATDIDKESLDLVKEKGFRTINSNLFSKISKTKKFNLITFNAPYLPEDKMYTEPKDSKRATTGGKRGDEISLKFLKQAQQHLTKDGKIFLLISSLTPRDRIKKFKPKIVARTKIFFERLLILEITQNKNL